MVDIEFSPSLIYFCLRRSIIIRLFSVLIIRLVTSYSSARSRHLVFFNRALLFPDQSSQSDCHDLQIFKAYLAAVQP
jgi:hypothetical protein